MSFRHLFRHELGFAPPESGTEPPAEVRPINPSVQGGGLLGVVLGEGNDTPLQDPQSTEPHIAPEGVTDVVVQGIPDHTTALDFAYDLERIDRDKWPHGNPPPTTQLTPAEIHAMFPLPPRLRKPTE
jgi:hypothetical protein